MDSRGKLAGKLVKIIQEARQTAANQPKVPATELKGRQLPAFTGTTLTLANTVLTLVHQHRVRGFAPGEMSNPSPLDRDLYAVIGMLHKMSRDEMATMGGLWRHEDLRGFPSLADFCDDLRASVPSVRKTGMPLPAALSRAAKVLRRVLFRLDAAGFKQRAKAAGALTAIGLMEKRFGRVVDLLDDLAEDRATGSHTH